MTTIVNRITYSGLVHFLLMVFVFVLILNNNITTDTGLWIEGILGGVALPSPLAQPVVTTVPVATPPVVTG